MQEIEWNDELHIWYLKKWLQPRSCQSQTEPRQERLHPFIIRLYN